MPSKGQALNLKLILRSINDSAVIAKLVMAFNDEKEDGTDEKIAIMTKCLLLRTFKFYVR